MVVVVMVGEREGEEKRIEKELGGLVLTLSYFHLISPTLPSCITCLNNLCRFYLILFNLKKDVCVFVFLDEMLKGGEKGKGGRDGRQLNLSYFLHSLYIVSSYVYGRDKTGKEGREKVGSEETNLFLLYISA